MRTGLAGAACFLAVLLAAAPARAKDDLVIGVAQFPSSLHPDIDPEVIKAYVVDFALRPITAYGPDWKNGCMLCAELPTVQNGMAKTESLADGKTGMSVTIRLKPDLKWGDGVPVTVKDLIFTWQASRDPAAGFSGAHAWQLVRAIDTVDDHTAVLHLSQLWAQYNDWDTSAGVGMLLPEHIEGPIRERAGDPANYIRQTAYNRAPTTPGLWDGPFMITGYQSGAQIVLEPNPNWAGHAPGFKRVVIKLIENTAALQANLLSGDVDMVAGEGVGLTIDQVIALKKQHPDRFTYIFKPSLTYEHIDLAKDNPILADLKVRQALLYAIDRQTMVQKLFEGLQPVAATWVNPLSPFYSKDVPTYAYDPQKARQLLAAAGWKPGGDGICRNLRGDRLNLELSTTSGNRLRELQEQVLQSQWKVVGVEVTIRNEPARTLFGETLKQRRFAGMVMYGWSSGVADSPRQTLASDQIPSQANNYSGANYIGFADPTMDKDIALVETELDPEKQADAWTEMQRLYASQLPVLPLFFRAEPHVVPKWLTGYTPTGHGDFSPLWAENWASSR